MFGLEHVIANTGSGLRIVRDGGDVVQWHAGALGIVGAVLAIILWVLVAIALVLAIITMIRRLRQPVGGPYGGRTLVAGAGVAAGAAPAAQNEPPAAGGSAPERPTAGGSPISALRILEDRYATGEITHDEYLERKRNLTGN
jgi:uncharacterized membrane protein